MSETLIIPTGSSKIEKYKSLLPQIEALIEGEKDGVANLANICAALRESFSFFWVGFYIVKGQELVLGPFQGPVACTRIGYGKGVCGTAWKEAKTVLVPDVDRFPGHIACSTASRSEIVVPAFRDGQVVLVLDIDSNIVNDFDETDQLYLENLMRILEKTM
jgi:GAF domain-containing protein